MLDIYFLEAIRMPVRKTLSTIPCMLLLLSLAAAADAQDFTAIQEVMNGKRSDADASWWGFDAADSTAALQAAIDSPAKRLLVPYMGKPWIVRPIRLRGDQEIVFAPGVVVLAQKGEFRGPGDSLFTAEGVSNLILRGYGATFRMWKSDYQRPPYKKAEWRMGVALRGCRKVLIEGLRVEGTGGDGFYVDGGGGRLWSEDITIRNCASADNHRQGISIISAVNLLVENCVFSGTSGTAPEAGIDLEPDAPNQRLVHCVIRNCVFENNRGHAMLVHLRKFDGNTEPVSILFDHCLARMTGTGGGWAGMSVGAVNDAGPQGLIEFRDCTAENTGREAAKVYDKSAGGAKVRFVRCNWKNPWNAAASDYKGPRVPVLIELRNPKLIARFGGVDFENCKIFDRADRPAIKVYEQHSAQGVQDLDGSIFVENPNGVRSDLGSVNGAGSSGLTVRKMGPARRP